MTISVLAPERAEMHALMHRFNMVLLCLLGSLAWGVDVVTQHNDVARSGANTAETVLTAANVNSATFGLLFTHAVDAEIYAQPLYLSGLTINGAVHNVVYVCTENNTVYAFDADDPAQVLPLWSSNLGPSLGNPPAEVGTGDIDLKIGITSTPVIDRANGVMYLVAKSLTAGVYANTLYALDIATGDLKTAIGGGSVTITATSPVNGIVMSAQHQQNRPGLLLLNGKLYLGFGSHGDNTPYNGWILEYDATTLAQLHLFCTTDINANSQGAVWQSGNGLATDGTDIYFMTGNGDSTIKLNGGALNGTGANVGMAECFIHLSPSLTLLDWFMPTNADALNGGDTDLGSGGPLVIQPPAGPQYLFGAGKQALGYLIKTSQFTSDSKHWNNAADLVQATIGVGNGADNKPGMVFWNGVGGSGANSYIYAWGAGSPVMQFAFNPNGGGANVPTLTSTGLTFNTAQGDRAGGLSLSANGPYGAHPGTGILWGARDANIFYAFNAENLSNTDLWDSNQVPARDSLGLFAKLSYPTIANGKVYVPTFSNTLNVYGLLASVTVALPAAPSALTASAVSSTGINLTWVNNALPVNSFTIQRSTSGTAGTFATVGVSPGTFFQDTGLTVATQYYYQVIATNVAGNSSSSNVATAVTQPNLPGSPVPAPWTDADIGAPGTAGSAQISAADVFSVSGGGGDIWNAADQFNFLYQTIAGDCQIVARVTGFPVSDADGWQKAGVMIRQDTTAGAANALMPLSFGNGFSFQWRLTAGGGNANVQNDPFTAPNNWVMLTRVGNVITGFCSQDGVNWTQAGAQTFTMPGSVLVGLAVTAHNNADLTTATFDNVAITTGTGNAATFSAITPAVLPAASGGTVTFSGANLGGTTAVTIGGTSVTGSLTGVSATGFTVTAPSHAAGPVVVVVTSSAGTVSGMLSYVTTEPSITQPISPANGPITGGTSITITGTNFGAPGAVMVGGNPATITAFTATTITAMVPAGTHSGAVSVIVSAGGLSSNPGTFTYTAGGASLPSISSVSPASGPYTGGTQITITGTQLAGSSGVNAVTIGGVAANSYVVVNSTTILAMTPPGTAANQPVVVTTVAGSSTTNGSFTYTGAPAAASSSGSSHHCGFGGLFGFIAMLALAALLRVIVRLRMR